MLAQVAPIIDPWFRELAGSVSVTVIVLVAVWRLFPTRRDLDAEVKARDERCSKCEKRMETTIQRPVFDDALNVIRADQLRLEKGHEEEREARHELRDLLNPIAVDVAMLKVRLEAFQTTAIETRDLVRALVEKG